MSDLGTGGQPEMIAALGNLGTGAAMAAQFNSTTGVVRAKWFGAGGGELALGNLSGYAGGAISFVITGDSDSFRVTSTAYGYDSGDRLYTALNAGFTSLHELGTTLSLLLATECAGDVNGSFAEIAYDRVVLATTPAGVGPVNNPPTDITLSNDTLPENEAPGTTVGTLAAVDADAGQTHAFTFAGGADDAAFTISGDTLTINGSADFETKSSYTVRIRATDSGSPALSYEEDLTVTIGDVSLPQEIQIISPLPAGVQIGSVFNVTAVGGASGQPVTFSTSGPATVSGGTVTITGAGAVAITLSQAGGGDYLPASDRVLNYNVPQLAQTIGFTLAATATTTDTIVLSATGGASGNPVTFSVVDGPGSISGSTLPFTGAGTVLVQASQAGNANYEAAMPVGQEIEVSAAVAGLTLVADTAFAAGGAVTIHVLGNDSTESGALTLHSVTQPTSGGKTKIVSGKVVFTPSSAVSTPITFSYTAGNGSTTGTATVTVRPQSIATGTFVGLLRRASDNSVRGRVVLTITAKGALSGSVRYEGSTFTLKGGLNSVELSVTGKGAVPRPLVVTTSGLDALGQPILALSIPDLATPGMKLTGTAERSPYGPGQATPDAGTYTMIAELPDGDTGPALAAAMGCTVSADGSVKFVGKFGNGVAVTQTGKLLSGGRLPFYVSLGTQRMGGELDFTKATVNQAIDGTLRWSVPNGGAAQLPGGLEQDYDVFGLSYTPGVNAAAMFNPAAPTATLTLVIPSLGVGSPVVRTATLSGTATKGTQKIYAPGDGSTYLQVTTTTGLFTGNRVIAHNVKRSYFGVILQGAGLNEGRGVLIEPTTLSPVTIAP